MRVFKVFFVAVLLACGGPAVYAGRSQSGNGNQAEGDKVFAARSTVKKAKIKSKPAPKYPGEAAGSNAGALVRLRMILRASGEVTDISTVKVSMTKGARAELADAFVREAVKAAEKVRFEPAQKDGQAVSQYIILEYSFGRR